MKSTRDRVATIADQPACFPHGESCRGYDCRLFGEGGEGEHECGNECFSGACGFGAIEVERESPEGEGGGEDVGVGECALREPDGINRGENDSDCGDCGGGE